MSTLHPTIKSFLDAWRARDHEAYVASFAPGFESMDPYGGAKTEAELRGHVDILEKTWSDLDYEIETVAGDGPVQAIAYTIHMTGKADGFEGKRVSLPCMAFVTLDGDKIKIWNETFDTGVLRKARKAAA